MATIESMLWDFILCNNIATENELNLVTDICGYNEESLKDIIYARTANRNIDQCLMDGYYLPEGREDEYIEMFELDKDESDEDE